MFWCVGAINKDYNDDWYVVYNVYLQMIVNRERCILTLFFKC